MASRSAKQALIAAFTLIELSIVLVVIGFIVGGVLVGRDLINAAAERAQITQIEKLNTAVNTFRGKFNALPGDLNGQVAQQFGFFARGVYAGEGDGNGVIEGVNWNSSGQNNGWRISCGETGLFWTDLTYANGMNINLIEGSFTAVTSSPFATTLIPSTNLSAFFPQAKLGQGGYVYVWSVNGINYFQVQNMPAVGNTWSCQPDNLIPSVSVRQAYDIDKKMDDGMPETGRVTSQNTNNAYVPGGNGGWGYGWNSDNGPTDTTTAIWPETESCYDNGGVATKPRTYSMSISNGNYVNCVLTFQFQ